MSKKKILPISWLYLGIALALIAGIFLFAESANPYYRALLVVALLFIVLSLTPDAKQEAPTLRQERNSMYKIFFNGIYGIIVILLVIGVWGSYALRDSAFHAVAMAVIILWACVFLGYFMWAVYFYNINYGLTEEEWDRIETNRQKKEKGEYYSEDEINAEPAVNPYRDQTFGLPPGTVRGMIAFTLLFGAIGMLIMSLGTTDCLECQAIIRDQYEFFKTAFLMMIAFYFGSRSLEILQGKGAGSVSTVTTAKPVNTQGVPLTDPTKVVEEVKVQNPMEPTGPVQPVVAQPPTTDEAIVKINPME